MIRGKWGAGSHGNHVAISDLEEASKAEALRRNVHF